MYRVGGVNAVESAFPAEKGREATSVAPAAPRHRETEKVLSFTFFVFAHKHPGTERAGYLRQPGKTPKEGKITLRRAQKDERIDGRISEI